MGSSPRGSPVSFLHLIYVGDFEVSDGSSLQMTRTSDDPIYKPVVRHPIDLEVVARLIPEGLAMAGSRVIPADWSIWLEDGYLVADRYALGVEEVRFLWKLVEETGYRLFERSFEVSVDDLTPKDHHAIAGEVPSSPASIA
jgi:hypothetical protein